jgi:hypothetical protein
MKDKGLPLAVLRAKAQSLKSMLETVEDKSKRPSVFLSESLNQLCAVTAEALPDMANLPPARIPPCSDNTDYSSEDFFTLLALTTDILGMIDAYS